jgi:hypothetical protein
MSSLPEESIIYQKSILKNLQVTDLPTKSVDDEKQFLSDPNINNSEIAIESKSEFFVGQCLINGSNYFVCEK